ncbi:hypothetical protein V7S43_014691 [Phytophthora oleae]|uniref:Transposase n=1 Tax=Phytophthora oleae TaxID=2107226 RepID=A0ABD3F3T6_9STRA
MLAYDRDVNAARHIFHKNMGLLVGSVLMHLPAKPSSRSPVHQQCYFWWMLQAHEFLTC